MSGWRKRPQEQKKISQWERANQVGSFFFLQSTQRALREYPVFNTPRVSASTVSTYVLNINNTGEKVLHSDRAKFNFWSFPPALLAHWQTHLEITSEKNQPEIWPHHCKELDVTVCLCMKYIDQIYYVCLQYHHHYSFDWTWCTVCMTKSGMVDEKLLIGYNCERTR